MTADENPDELVRNALSCEDRGEIRAAASLLRRVVECVPTHAAAWRHLGVLLAQLADERCLVSWRDRVICQGADTAGLSCGAPPVQEEYIEAREAMQKGLALEPTASGYVLLGDVQGALGLDAQAEESFKTAMELDPDWDEAMFNLAVLYRTREPEEAERLLRRALAIDAGVPAYHRELGFVLGHRRKLEEAEVSLRRALELDADDFWTHLYLGTVIDGQGRGDEAQAEYSIAVELEPSLALAHVFLGDFFSRAERSEDAEHHYRTAVRVEPSDPLAAYKLGTFLREHGAEVEAVSWLQKYLALDQDDALGRAEEVRQWLSSRKE